MPKKLNDSIDKARLRLLSLKQLQRRVTEVLETQETDSEGLDRLSEEVQSRLAQAHSQDERDVLEELADRLVRHRFMQALEQEEWSEIEQLLKESKLRDRLWRDRDDDDDFLIPRAACMCSVSD